MNKIDKAGLYLRYGMFMILVAIVIVKGFWPPDMVPHPHPPEPKPIPNEAITR